jgi:outer membrane protein TolC
MLFLQFSLAGGVNWQSSQFNTWFQSPNRSSSIGPSMTWPFFHGGANVANIHAQEALRDKAFITYQQTVLTALQDVENALIDFAEEQKHYNPDFLFEIEAIAFMMAATPVFMRL